MEKIRTDRRRALEAEGIHFIDARVWIIKRLMKVAFKTDPDITLAFVRDLAKSDWQNDEILP